MVLRKLKFDPITDDLRDQLPSYADGLEASAASNPSTNPVQTWCSCLQVPTCMLLLHMISPVGNGSSVYDRPRMEILLFLEHGLVAWTHGALQSLAQHYGTRCR